LDSETNKKKFDPESLKLRNTAFKTSATKDIITALLLMFIIIAGEFTARRVVAVILPTYFDYFFMDLICLGGFYAILCTMVYMLIGGDVAEKTCYTGFSLRDWYQRTTFYNAALVIMLGITILNRLDLYLFSGINWNLQVISYLNTLSNTQLYANTPLYPEDAKLAISIAFILINGIWVPIAEEFFWRGTIQTKLSYYLSPWTMIILVSVFFSIKHAVVDLVLTRLLFLISFGIAAGWAKQRTNTGVSTSAHIYINLLGTLFWIAIKIY
jgi:membrane protease YdiL (CAAX protease family)